VHTCAGVHAEIGARDQSFKLERDC